MVVLRMASVAVIINELSLPADLAMMPCFIMLGQSAACPLCQCPSRNWKIGLCANHACAGIGRSMMLSFLWCVKAYRSITGEDLAPLLEFVGAMGWCIQAFCRLISPK